ncbi:hypothetical protein FACS189475_02180 [Betaproteobacteria bacterium]|nr:hypothetical protein FACS189475_02180 [Betaproteobacteria bacterium]
MLKNPENIAKVDAIAEEINKYYSEFSELRTALEKIESHRDTLLKAAEASKGEAENAHEELKQVMHATAGKPGKALMEKQAAHRAALEMAEDYKALAEEADKEAIEIRIQMSEPARNLEHSRRDLYKTFTRLVLEEAIGEIAQSLKIAYDAVYDEYRRPEFMPSARHVFFNEKEIIDDLLLESIRKVFRPEKISAELPDYIRDAMRKHTRGFKPFSPLQIAMRLRGNPAVDRALQQNPERKAYPL